MSDRCVLVPEGDTYKYPYADIIVPYGASIDELRKVAQAFVNCPGPRKLFVEDESDIRLTILKSMIEGLGFSEGEDYSVYPLIRLNR